MFFVSSQKLVSKLTIQLSVVNSASKCLSVEAIAVIGAGRHCYFIQSQMVALSSLLCGSNQLQNLENALSPTQLFQSFDHAKYNQLKPIALVRFNKEEEITVDWAVDAKIPEGRSSSLQSSSWSRSSTQKEGHHHCHLHHHLRDHLHGHHYSHLHHHLKFKITVDWAKIPEGR